MSSEILFAICGGNRLPFASFTKVNLNGWAKLCYGSKEENPLLDPNLFSMWLASMCKINGYRYTYGGYMEDRSWLWRGHYMKKGRMFHYGVDVNVPVDTEIKCPVPFKVIELFSDEDQNGGWGGRAILKIKGGYVIFAHLDLHSNLSVGREYDQHRVIGWVSPSTRNGGWFPHVHIQGLRSLDLMNGLDGYGPMYKNAMKDYPDPLEMMS